MPDGTGSGTRLSSQRWTSFVRNHAQSILASDFFVAVTANFRILSVLVIMEIGTRRIVHFNVTNHPTAEWTLQQFREVIQGKEMPRFLIHDRDSIYSVELDLAIKSTGLKILKTPVRAPTANAYCERLIGTIRREYMDFMIPLNERHLRRLLTEWVAHYNKGRPHSSLGPGIPDRPVVLPDTGPSRHQIPRDHRVVAKSVLGGCIMNIDWRRLQPENRATHANGPSDIFAEDRVICRSSLVPAQLIKAIAAGKFRLRH